MRSALVLFSALVPLLGLGGPAAAADAANDYPPPAYVVDTAGLLPPAVEHRIGAELASFEDRTSHQMAVVLVPALNGQSDEDYARGLFDRWGIGRTGVNDGALLLVGLQERRVRVQVGAGLHAALTDDDAVKIVNDITPALHDGRYTDAVLRGERAIRTQAGDTQLDLQDPARTARFSGGVAVPASTSGHTPGWLVVVTLAVIGGVLATVIAVVGRDLKRRGGGPGSGGGGWTGAIGAGAAGGAAGAGGAVGGGGGASGGF
jgi:uncharacterized protein